MRPSTGCGEEGLCQADKVWQDIASQAQERTKQREQPGSPIKTRPLPEVLRPGYQEQGKAETADLRYGIQQFKTWFQIASLSVRFESISWHRNRSSGSR